LSKEQNAWSKESSTRGIAVIKKYLAAKTGRHRRSFRLAATLFGERKDIPAHLEATAKLCQLHLKAQDTESAWQDFLEYTNAGGDRLPRNNVAGVVPPWQKGSRITNVP